MVIGMFIVMVFILISWYCDSKIHDIYDNAAYTHTYDGGYDLFIYYF